MNEEDCTSILKMLFNFVENVIVGRGSLKIYHIDTNLRIWYKEAKPVCHGCYIIIHLSTIGTLIKLLQIWVVLKK